MPGKLLLIGRAKDNDIVLNDRRASRKHAQIMGDAAGFRIIDGYIEGGILSRSVNHVFVNGEAIAEKNLERGDIITIGESRLEYREITDGRAASGWCAGRITKQTVEQNAITVVREARKRQLR